MSTPFYQQPEIERIKAALRSVGQLVKVTTNRLRRRGEQDDVLYGELLGVAENFLNGTSGYGLVLRRPRGSATLVFVRLSIVDSITTPTEEEWRLVSS